MMSCSRRQRRSTASCLITLCVLALSGVPAIGEDRAPASPATSAERLRPTMGEFMGLNVHTIQFKPDLYAPVCRLVRDYHPVGWDFSNEDPTGPTKFPMAANGVPWGTMYASWNKAGFEIDACLIFDAVAPAKWKDPARDARAYGQAFAQAFGPSSKS